MSVNCLVTVYYPTEKHISNIIGLSKQVDRVFVCDNTPDVDNFFIFSGLADNLIYITNKKNLGLSMAFNVVLKNKELQFFDDDYIIFFDQDSELKENHIQNLINCYKKIERFSGNIGALGPSYFDKTVSKKRVAKIKKKSAVKNCFEVSQIITSSMLIKYGNLKKVGFWNEKIFLDFADWDLCFRLKSVGLKIFVTLDVIMEHTLGRDFKKILFIIKRYDSPIREYYQTREALKLYMKKYVPLKFRLKFIFVFLVRPFVNCTFLPEKRERRFYIKLAKKDSQKNGACCGGNK